MKHISEALFDAYAILEENTFKAQSNDTSMNKLSLNQWNPDSQAKFLFPFKKFAVGEVVEFVKKSDDKLSIVRTMDGEEFHVPHQYIQVSIKIREVSKSVAISIDDIL